MTNFDALVLASVTDVPHPVKYVKARCPKVPNVREKLTFLIEQGYVVRSAMRYRYYLTALGAAKKAEIMADTKFWMEVSQG